jgi:ATP/maltotriose-dependent transcriptional regulator MalT
MSWYPARFEGQPGSGEAALDQAGLLVVGTRPGSAMAVRSCRREPTPSLVNILRKGRHIDAREQLRTAHDTLAAIGMEAFAERARRELVATGETVRKRTVDTVAKLTTQEAHIAQLARDGRTNPEIGAQLFLSARTVEWHLRKVFNKLGISSRRELHTALAW